MKLALLLIGVLALMPACRPGAESRQTSVNQPAATTVSVTSPRGDVAWPFVFEWTTNARPGALCRVTVFDTAERRLLQRDSKEQRLAAPKDLELLLPTSRRFLWRVSVLGEDGDAVAESPLTGFSVK